MTTKAILSFKAAAAFVLVAAMTALVFSLTWSSTSAGATSLGGDNFTGDYAIENWTFSNNPAGVAGSWSSAPGPPVTLTLVGGNAEVAGTTDFTITVPASGTLTFDWTYTTADSPGFDSGGYVVDGTYTELATAAGSGSGSVNIGTGSTFAFRVETDDGQFGAGTIAITNFVYTPGEGPTPTPPGDTAWANWSNAPTANSIVTFDTNNPAAFTVIGPTGISNEEFINGIAFDGFGEDATLYLTSNTATNFFYEINQSTGAATLIGGSGLTGGDTVNDLAWDPVGNRMLALGATGTAGSGTRLYEINTATGAATNLGTITNFADDLGISLAVRSDGVIFVHGLSTDTWVTVDRTTLAATTLGPLGWNSNFGQGAGFTESDQLYHTLLTVDAGNQSRLALIDQTTGAPTFIGNLGSSLSQLGDVTFGPGGAGPTPTPTITPTPTPGPGGTFPGTGTGPIPDGAPGGTVCGDFGAPLDISFAVSGISGAPTNVELEMDITHTWGADVWVDLIAPDGTTTVTIFKQRGAATATACGSGNDLGGVYNFTDSAPTSPSFFNVAGNPVPSGDYRAVAPLTGNPVDITAAFAGLSDANGTWIMRVRDGGEADLGSVAAANLTVTGSGGTTSGSGRADFDGDGATDVSVFRGSEGNWYINGSTDGFMAGNFGLASDTLVPADFDGDGKTDLAVFRPSADESAADFYIYNSGTGTVSGLAWGVPGDIAAVGNYDSDAMADVAVFRPSEGIWYILSSANGLQLVSLGTATSTVAVGDFDGDGITDPGVFENGNWNVILSGGGVIASSFGQAGDVPVVGDYDGDGKSDLAVFRAGTWHILNSGDGTTVAIPFGIATDIPAPGDYDGDGTDDQAVYRDGQWWINGSTSGVVAVNFGLASDSPVPASANP